MPSTERLEGREATMKACERMIQKLSERLNTVETSNKSLVNQVRQLTDILSHVQTSLRHVSERDGVAADAVKDAVAAPTVRVDREIGPTSRLSEALLGEL